MTISVSFFFCSGVELLVVFKKNILIQNHVSMPFFPSRKERAIVSTENRSFLPSVVSVLDLQKVKYLILGLWSNEGRWGTMKGKWCKKMS